MVRTLQGMRWSSGRAAYRNDDWCEGLFRNGSVGWPVTVVGWLRIAGLGVALIVWAPRLSLSIWRVASGVSAFALAILLAGAEPEQLTTAVTASLRSLQQQAASKQRSHVLAAQPLLTG